ATAIQRMADGTIARSIASPSGPTSANEKISTHEMAKNTVVKTISRLFTSTETSFLSTRSAVRRNIWARTLSLRVTDQSPVLAAQTRRGRLVADQLAIADHGNARHQPLRQIEVVRRDHDDRPGCSQSLHPIDGGVDRPVVEPGEGLVEQHEPRIVQQRALEPESLAHPPREAGHRIVSAVGQTG